MAASLDPQLPEKRCAIYARKSQEPGLDQYFNSLEAQKELCSAFITSQKHRGWKESGKVYVDVARSGGTLDRPALQELLADVEAGFLDIVVIYKLDRLSRSLLDFVRLMGVLERNKVSFVCVTQNFDTGESLGRLIMNVLLTFAQFERELSGDRIRDKRRAMASRGFWIGSKPPYGYDYVGKRLVPNEAEAKIVRFIFGQYLQLHSIKAVFRACTARGITSKVRVSKEGVLQGGDPIHNATVRTILCNPVYCGDVTHLGKRYPGTHKAILSRKQWNDAEQIRLNTTCERLACAPLDLLPARVFDCFGRRMSLQRKYYPTRCERFYYSYRTAWGAEHQVPRMRSRADSLEELVIAAISTFLANRRDVRSVLLERGYRDLDIVTPACEVASRRVAEIHAEQKAAILEALVARIEVTPDCIKIAVRTRQLVRFLGWDGLVFFQGESCSKVSREATYLLSVPAMVSRMTRKLRLPVMHREPGSKVNANPKLLRLLAQARRAQRLVDFDREKPVEELAAKMERSTGAFMKLLWLNYLAPDIITAIRDGKQPPSLKPRRLLDAHLPSDWALQRKLFGFPEQPLLRTPDH
jgi:site-specific DNA recombinase